MRKNQASRREFLKEASLGLFGTCVPNNFSTRIEPKASIIKEYRTLGKTGFKVSDISAGAPENETVLKALLNSGVNFIDTSEVYTNGNNERLIGKVMKEYDRKKIFVATKIYTNEGFGSKDEVLNRIRGCLERLQFDYVDCVMIHHAHNSQILKDESYHAAIAQLKEEGRVGYSGVSCHGSAWIEEPEEKIDTVLLNAANDGRFDVFLMTYNFLNAPLVEKVLDACHEKGIGTAIMKSNPVKNYLLIQNIIEQRTEKGEEISEKLSNYYNNYKDAYQKAKEYFSKYGADNDEDLKNAATRFVLNNPRINTICISFDNIESIGKYLSLSGQKLEPKDVALLSRYHETFGFLNCRVGCNECEKHCPHNLPVNYVMRYQYYFNNKRKEKYAIQLYNGLKSDKADLCVNCPGYCQNACPFGVETKHLMSMANDQFSLNDIQYG